MGRPVKADLQGHRSKEEKEARIAGIQAKTTEVKAPSYLNPEAKKEFDRVANATNIGELDVAVLAVYADAWVQYRRLAKIIADHGAVIVKKRVTGKVDIYNNPALTAQAEYVHRIMQCSLKLGLAVTDRMRLAIPKREDDNDEFSEFEGAV